MPVCSRCSAASFLAALLVFAPQDAQAQERQKPASEQQCAVIQPDSPLRSTRPAEPDSASALALSWKATTAAIDTLLDRADIDQPGTIVVEYDPASRKRSLELDDLDYPKPLREEIARRLDLHFNRWPEPYRILAVGPSAETHASTRNRAFESCPPALRNREYITRLLKETVARYPGGRDRAPSRTVNVWLFTNKSGRVLIAHVKDPSGDTYYDREAKRIGREFQFHPLLQDGIPTHVWVNIPIVFAIRR